jgi:hypothetical protein
LLSLTTLFNIPVLTAGSSKNMRFSRIEGK